MSAGQIRLVRKASEYRRADGLEVLVVHEVVERDLGDDPHRSDILRTYKRDMVRSAPADAYGDRVMRTDSHLLVVSVYVDVVLDGIPLGELKRLILLRLHHNVILLVLLRRALLALTIRMTVRLLFFGLSRQDEGGNGSGGKESGGELARLGSRMSSRVDGRAYRRSLG
jgi:hypothetical protein